MSNREKQMLYYSAVATVGFFSGLTKSVSGYTKIIDTAQNMAAGGIATRSVQETTRRFCYLGHEDSKLFNSLAQVQRGAGIFAKTATITIASSKLGEMVGEKINSYRK